MAMAMDSGYGIRLNVQQTIESPLRFSVLNILRPDFGREAILSTKTSANPNQLHRHRHSPLPVARDLSVASANAARDVTRLSPLDSNSNSNSNSNSGQSRLSRSGSLESLASNRSSLTGSSVAGTPSISSAASSVGESVSGDSSAQSGAQSLWPAWVYCTRYSDRPSSGWYYYYTTTTFYWVVIVGNHLG